MGHFLFFIRDQMSGVVGRRAEETELDGLGKLSFLCRADAD